ncbi:MAG TPA: hypothetical protein VFP50_13735, partial [Anaeromyxobacteraceae bacterium]|nr:hypothetical protein [Anaeromyxobacteraceae bacterium]
MDEALLFALAGVYLLAPVALAIALAVQGRRRKDLEERVERIATQVEALGKRVAAMGHAAEAPAAPAAAVPAPSPQPSPPEPVYETTLPPPLPPIAEAAPSPQPSPPVGEREGEGAAARPVGEAAG